MCRQSIDVGGDEEVRVGGLFFFLLLGGGVLEAGHGFLVDVSGAG